MPRGITRIVSFYPHAQTAAARGVALNYRSEGGGDAWALFFSSDGKAWRRLLLPEAPKQIADFRRLGPGEIAVKGSSQRRRTKVGWAFYEIDRSNTVWNKVSIPGAPDQIDDIQTFDESPTTIDTLALARGLGVRSSPANGPDSGKWTWLYRDRRQRWVDLRQVVPRLPPAVEAVKDIGDHNILAFRESDAVNALDGAQWRYFYFDTRQRLWTPLEPALPNLGGGIFSLKTFAGNRGIAAQVFSDSQIGRRLPGWRVYYRDRESRWVLFQSVARETPAEVWDVRPYGAPPSFGVGIQELGDWNGDGRIYDTLWLVNQSGAWTSLSQFAPEIDFFVADLRSDRVSDGFAVQTGTNPGHGLQSLRWYWFLPAGGGLWKEVEEVLGLPRNTLDRDDAWRVQLPRSDSLYYRQGVISVTVSGHVVWYLKRPDGRCVSVDQQIREALK
jgi:hypothetical protein